MNLEHGPKGRLLTRMVIFFLIAALPSLLVSALAVAMLDGLIAQAIEERCAGVITQAKEVLSAERTRVRSVLGAVASSEDIRQLAQAIEVESAVEAAEGLAGEGAAASLDLFEIAAVAGPYKGTIISSAHLPNVVGDPAPAFIQSAAIEPTVGLVHALAPGNPPRRVPALVALVSVPDSRGRPALVLYGGARLDGRRLKNIASMGDARLVLDSPGLNRLVFDSAPKGAKPRTVSIGASIALSALPKGRVSTSGQPIAPADDARPSKLRVGVYTDRLETSRRVFLERASLLILAALGVALCVGVFLSRRVTRPIVELSQAARKVGAGDLDVRITPRTQDEVGHLVQVFNDMTGELKESRVRLRRAERIAAWREIARRVAHEIKNPLFPIQMSMETLQKSYQRKHPKLDEIVEESTRTVLEEVRALNRIVTEFSEFARLPAPQKTTFDPLELLAHVQGLYAHPQTSEGQKPVTVIFDPLAAVLVPKLNADREQLSRALINLVKNAIEAMKETGGTVNISATERDGHVVLEISDDGPGMPDEMKSKVFTPYFTTKSEGTGLGLAIVDRIVTEHAGRIDLITGEGEGTTFRIWIPI